MNEPRVYASDDYAGLEAGGYKFYFGYEEVWCPVHGHVDVGHEDCEEETEWAFVATRNGKELVRYKASEIDFPGDNENMPEWGILKGIAKYLDEKEQR